jgi:hypothetical protein
MSESTVSAPTDASQHENNGRFRKGNAGGPGNPFARQVAQLRAALINAVTGTDIRQIAEQLLAQARQGNLAAIKLLLQYVLGKPTPMVNPDTLDVEEWRQIHQPTWQAFQQLPHTMGSPSMEILSGIVRRMQPAVLRQLEAVFAPPQPEPHSAASDSERVKQPRAVHTGARAKQPSGDRTASGRERSLDPLNRNGSPRPPSTNGESDWKSLLPPLGVADEQLRILLDSLQPAAGKCP